MTISKVAKWLGAGAAIMAIGAGLFGADSATQARFGNGATSALAAPPDALDPALGPIQGWVPGDSNIYVAEAPAGMTLQAENTTLDSAGTIQFVSTNLGSVSEGAGAFAFDVERTGSTVGAVSAGCAVFPPQTSASNVSDYNVLMSFVSWQHGESGVRPCIIQIFNDELGGEGDETVTLILTPPFNGGAAAGPNLAATVTIEDNDPPLLVFTTHPGDGQTGLALVQQPVVEIHSGLGETLGDIDAEITLSVDAVTQSIFTTPSISCEPNPLATDSGVATFSGCVITGAHGGMEIQLKATAPGMATALSEVFFVADSNYDANCNGETTGDDALALLRSLAGFSTGMLPVAPCTGDADDSGGISLLDALLIRLFVAGSP